MGKKVFWAILILLFMFSQTVFAEKQEWVDKNYDFKKAKTILVWVTDIEKSINNGINEKEINEIMEGKSNLTNARVITCVDLMLFIGKDYNIDIQELLKTNPKEAVNTMFKYVPVYADIIVFPSVFSYGYGSTYRTPITYNTTNYQTSYVNGIGGTATIQTPTTETHTLVPGGKAKVVYAGVKWDAIDAKTGNAVFTRIDDRAKTLGGLQNTKPKSMLNRITESFYSDLDKLLKKEQ